MFEAKTGARVLGFKTSGRGAARVEETGFINGVAEITFNVACPPPPAVKGVCERLANKALVIEVGGVSSPPLLPKQRLG